MDEEVAKCERCALHVDRANSVLGEGPLDAALMFVGEGPGAEEDAQGKPFVGKAGQLLDKIMKAAGISREEVYISNIVKCRPPGNRVPSIEEIVMCQKFLEAQIAVINPEIIVCLGNTPSKWILGSTEGITKLRGRWFVWRGIDVMPMFHPSYLLRNESRQKDGPKALTWLDIQEVKRRLDIAKARSLR
nr:uracil-DNA glycosylase [uncultured Dethiosulfovibrio sp.]